MMGLWRAHYRAAAVLASAIVLASSVAGAGVAAGPALGDARGAITRGEAYLIAQQQPDGSWEGHVGFTAVALLALLPTPGDANAPAAGGALRGFRYLERWVRPDGGIHQDDIKHYTTAVALLAFAASGDPKYRDRIAGARDFLVQLQAREDKGFTEAHANFGGTLIGGGKANLDATFFALRAVAEAGLPRGHPYWARALRFVSRCQNWRATNDQPWTGPDGGFVFSPGFSFAGGTTSYGTMTYAGLSAYKDLGLRRDDPRVEAGFAWFRSNFTAGENPGLGQQALYHSYFYMAHTLRRWGVDTFVDRAGRERSWRQELTEALLRRQRADGSWANTEDPRWFESKPVLATSFAVRALKEAAVDARW